MTRVLAIDPGVITRFATKVDRSGGPDACWLWTGAQDGRGYGALTALSLSSTPIKAHRLAYAIAHDRPLEDIDTVCHRCDIRLCCNPAHLFDGTVADNNADARRKGRAVAPPDPRGERNPAAKLSAADVDAVRAALAAGETGRSIAARFGVSPSTVSLINRGRRWAS